MSGINQVLEPLKKAVSSVSPVGPSHFEQARRYVRSGVAFGVGGAILGCYFLEWKAVLQFLPYYNGKYKSSSRC